MTFLTFPSHCHRIIPIPIPTHSHSNTAFPFPYFPITSIPILTHSHSNFRQQLYIDYLKAKKYVYYVLNSKQNMKLQQKHCKSNSPLINHHHYNYHCLSLFTVQRLSDCHCMLLCKKQQAIHTAGGNFIFRLQNMLFPFPFQISSPKLLPFLWESHGNPMEMGIVACVADTVVQFQRRLWRSGRAMTSLYRRETASGCTATSPACRRLQSRGIVEPLPVAVYTNADSERSTPV